MTLGDARKGAAHYSRWHKTTTAVYKTLDGQFNYTKIVDNIWPADRDPPVAIYTNGKEEKAAA